MNEVEYMRNEEEIAFGVYLIETIANLYGCKADPDSVNNEVYSNTRCGAWVQFDEDGILVGTIVEGSDAEYSERVTLTDLPDKLIANFRLAIENCEDFADENWDGI